MAGEERIGNLQATSADEKSSTGDHQENTMTMKAQDQSPSQVHKGNKSKEDEKKKENLDEKLYEVEAILSRRNYNGELQYLIKWCNYPESESTWEPYENVECLSEMLKAFERRYSSLRMRAEDNNGMEDEKLDENSYEVEAIRKKRNYKGQLQYLIKWRNYSEANNTWEPYDNIKHCTEMLEAFGQSSQEHKRKVKTVLPKRKCSIQIKDDGDGATNDTSGEENSPLLSKERGSSGKSGLARANFLNQKPVYSHDNKEMDVIKNNNGKEKVMNDEAISINSIYIDLPKQQQGVEAMNKQGGTNFVMQDYVQKWREKVEAKGGVGAAAMSIFLPNDKEDIAGQGKDPSKDGNQLTDAKKRKSGPVRRFVSPDVDSTEAVAATVVSGSNTTDTNNKIAKDEHHLTKILKPVEYCIPTSPSSDSNHHVYISFMALRSDGTQVRVSNKELRAINPLLLIDFYEQHLRYTPDP